MSASEDTTFGSAALARPPLREIVDFGPNRGNLRMYLFAPNEPAHQRPLVVVLHGCRQTAERYDLGSGWSRLAEVENFLVLYPEQRRTNNRDGCFSWFEPERCRDEIESIREMIATAVARYRADRRKIYICGLSAGGAMACGMLATHPELIAGGAVIAGLPYGTALNLSEAYESMAGRTKKAKVWGDLVKAASRHDGRWPSVAIWQGMADKIVNPINAGELVKQWTSVHGVGAAVPAEDHLGKTTRRAWCDRDGRVCVTEYSVPGLAHGAPVDETESPVPYFLPAGISSTRQIAHDWGLTDRALDAPSETLAAPGRSRRRLWSIFGL